MRFAPSEDHTALAEALRGLLAAVCPTDVVRRSWDNDSATRAVLRQLGGGGLLGALTSQNAGGLALTAEFVPLALEQVGYFAAPGPISDTVTVAAPLLAAIGHRLTDEVLAGETLVACALGRSGPTPYAASADLILAEAQDGPRVFERHEVKVTAQRSIDGSRGLGQIEVLGEGLALPPEGVEMALQAATLGAAAELVGLAQRMLDMTVMYVRQREQFGRPVGSFQAIKHHLADSLLRIAFARPAVMRAGATLANRHQTAQRDVSIAKAVASEAAGFVSQRAIQCHGAMGYTVEYDLHLFAKRAWALRTDRGDTSEHRQKVATLLGIPEFSA